MSRDARSGQAPLPRLLSKLGLCSRRDAEQRVVAGRVMVNGRVVRDVMAWVSERDSIVVDGTPLRPVGRVYLKMNKPRGIITTVRDERGRRCVADLLPPQQRGAMPVGRLDRDSSGLLLLTNDHDLGNAVTAGEGLLEKVYRVAVDGHPEEAQFAPMREGIELDGHTCRPARVDIVERRPHTTVIEIGLHEGRNRQIRRSLALLDCEVRSLVRIAIGPILLGDMASGSVAQLSDAEHRALLDACEQQPPTAPDARPPRT